jgi:hypothetical protein
MKPFFLLAGLLTIVTSSCQQPGTKTTTTQTDSTRPAAILNEGPQCFSKITTAKDTAYIRFETDNEVVSGQLEYKLFEKDKNTGTISGTITDNIIDVDYRFMSEGIMSVRKAIFKLDNNQLFEATPEKLDNDGQPVFDKDKLHFDSIPFVKGKCR